MISYIELERGIARWKARQAGQEVHDEAATGEAEAVAYAEVAERSSGLIQIGDADVDESQNT